MSNKPVALLINDIHVSKDKIEDFLINWKEAVDLAIENDIKTILLGGDLFHSRASQTLDVLLAVKSSIDYAADNGISIIASEGNHDKVDQNMEEGYCHVFDKYRSFHSVSTIEQVKVSTDTNVYMLSFFRDKSITENIVKSLVLDKSKYNILYPHLGIIGALNSPMEEDFPAELFEDFDAVLVGHYHNRCKIRGTNVQYIGSSRQHNFGEDEEKGYTLLYSDGKTEFIKNKVNIRYKTVKTTTEDILSGYISKQLENIDKNKYLVRVVVSCKSSDTNKIDKQKLFELGINKIELDVEDSVIAKTDNRSLEHHFDKASIKDSYIDFCNQKDFDSTLGLSYINQTLQ